MPRVLMILAALMGAAGVVLAALGAHANASLGSAANILLFHAPMVFVTLIAAARGLLQRRLSDVAAIGFVLGAALFAGDIAVRAYFGRPLFPMAAPSGGFVLIASWLVLAGAALGRSGQPDAQEKSVDRSPRFSERPVGGGTVRRFQSASSR